MSLRNCTRCGRVFMSDGHRLCRQCRKEENEQFELVKEYLARHKNTNIFDVSEATGVATERIREWIRQGRLVSVTGERRLLTCERCGLPIDRGRLCALCQQAMKEELGGGRKKHPEKAGGRGSERMHSADFIKKRQKDRLDP